MRIGMKDFLNATWEDAQEITLVFCLMSQLRGSVHFQKPALNPILSSKHLWSPQSENTHISMLP